MASPAGDILKKLIELGSALTSPAKYVIGNNIEDHITQVNSYISNIKCETDEQKKLILTSSLDEEARYELFSLLDYDEKHDYKWLCEKLRALYKPKISKVSPYQRMLKVKQGPSSLREFLTRIRVEGYKQLKDAGISKEKREQHMISAFIKGMNNKDAASALEMLAPTSLDEAFECVKRENRGDSETEYVRAVAPQDARIDAYEKEISILKRKISSMEERLKLLENKGSSPQGQSQNRRQFVHREERFRYQRNNSARCYNCNQEGHFARNCSQRPMLFCSICNRSGHDRINCRQRIYYRSGIRREEVRNPGRRENLRNMEEISQSSQKSSVSKVHDWINSADSNEDADTADHTEELFSVIKNTESTANNKRQKQKQTRMTNRKQKTVQYPKDICEAEEYILGKRGKPKFMKKTKTLISKTRSEPAANKPLTKGRVQGVETNLFFDTGAESNILDYLFFKELQGLRKIHLHQCRKKLTCANGSSMKVLGIATLRVQLGKKSLSLSFTVVESLFPRVIIGLKDMKRHDIRLLPKFDCVQIDDENVPFVSKTRIEPENEAVPGFRVPKSVH